MQQLDRDYLFDNSNGCLAYFHHVYPQSIGHEDKKRAFRIRSAQADPNPSTHLFKGDKGVYYIKDFGSTDKAMNAIDLCMQEEGIEKPYEAMAVLYRFFDLQAPQMASVSAKWHQDKTELTKEHTDIKELDEPKQLAVFAPFLTPKQANQYGLSELEYYEFVSFKKDEAKKPTKEKQLNRVFATEQFPIFCFSGPGFQKVYQPKAEQARRFMFLGKKPERYVYGWERLFNEYAAVIGDYDERIKLTDDESEKEELQRQKQDFQFDEVYIVSGGSDGLNLVSLGKRVIWFNSESEQITWDEYWKLVRICKVIYYVADLDSAGVDFAVKMGMEFLDIKIIWLPLTGMKGDKDLRDWLKPHRNKPLDKLQQLFEGVKSQAKEFRWWYFEKGAAKFKPTNLIYFLQHSGFAVFPLVHGQQAKGAITNIFVQVKDHTVKEVHYSEIKKYLMKWCVDRQISLKVQDALIKSQGLNEKQMLALPTCSLNFTAANKTSQVFHFKNYPVRITADGIDKVAKKDIHNFVWEENIIGHALKNYDVPQFTIYTNPDTNALAIDILKTDNVFFNYLINTSRVHWRDELEKPFEGKSNAEKEAYHSANRFNLRGEYLTDEQKQEQVQHLINKIYGFGYLLHSYKDQSKPWCLYMMDNHISESIAESKGGTGKSFGVSKLLKYFKNMFYIEGRNPRILDNQFIYDGVDEDTDTIFVDDAHSSLNFSFFFSMLTGDMKINPKHGKPFALPFNVSPKLVITTNYAPTDVSESVMRRLFFMMFSDYYHQKSNDYAETRSIADDFGGKELFSDDFTPAEWNDFYVFSLQCLQFYLGQKQRVDAPRDNFDIRAAKQYMGDNFQEWAESYFTESNLNRFIPRKVMQEDYMRFVGPKAAMSVQKHKKAVERYCTEIQGWEFNPGKEKYSNNVIKMEYYDGDVRQSIEHYYIKTPDTSLQEPAGQQQPATPPKPEQPGMFDNHNDDDDDVNTDGLEF